MDLPLLKKTGLPPDTVSLFEGVAGLPGGILLDSGMVIKGFSRYSFMSADPFLTVTSRGGSTVLEWSAGPRAGEVERLEGNPFDIIKRLLEQYRTEPGQCPFPFFGGAAGFFSYDLGRRIERLPEMALDDTAVPDCRLGFYDVVAAVDHQEGAVYISSTGFPLEGSAERESYGWGRLHWLEERLGRGMREANRAADRGAGAVGSVPPGAGAAGMASCFTPEGYCGIVERAREYIAAGDIFQVNLSQRFCLPAREDPWEVYVRLREINPAPMAAYLDCGDYSVVCASPERFLKVSSGVVETRPIKGTRPRSGIPEKDAAWRDELWNSEKDRAELVMIVDLERNDLGRVCRPGTVHVPELYRLEEYPTVFHLVSTVEGRLERGKTAVDLLEASFPGGSITGAPKIRAMEIIEELEPVRRGIYCGSIGYLAFNGDADLNIVIRTMIFTEKNIYINVGGGITIDSDPRAEYLETLDKARALVRVLGIVI
ncbi:MAG: aminodeoxychorismate synthase component I [Bacillota bacterium]